VGDGIGQRELHGREGLAVRGAEVLQAAGIFGERGIVGVIEVGDFGDEDAVGFKEASEVIDMAVGIVADEAIVEPEHFIRSEAGGELAFDSRRGGLAVAAGVEHDDFGRQNVTGTVTFDGAAFEHLVESETADAELIGDPGGGAVVFLLVGEFVAPGVVAPVGDAEFAPTVVNQKEWAEVTYPDVVSLVVVELDGGGVAVRCHQLAEDRLLLGGAEHADGLVAGGEHVEGGELHADAVEAVWPEGSTFATP